MFKPWKSSLLHPEVRSTSDSRDSVWKSIKISLDTYISPSQKALFGGLVNAAIFQRKDSLGSSAPLFGVMPDNCRFLPIRSA